MLCKGTTFVRIHQIKRYFSRRESTRILRRMTPVRLISSIVESLDLSTFRKLYRERGRNPYNPKMLLKVVIYAYMNNIYSCRRIEKALKRASTSFGWQVMSSPTLSPSTVSVTDYLLNLSPTKPSPTSPDIKSKCLKSGGVGARS